MEETPDGTPVGVDDPYDHADACDHLTNDGRCRYALNHAGADREFAQERRAEDYACVAAADDTEWTDCPHYRSTTDGKACTRCGLEEVRMAHDDTRPLIEEHHLSYGTGSAENGGGNSDPDRDSTADTDLSTLTDAVPQRTLDEARDVSDSQPADPTDSGPTNPTDSGPVDPTDSQPANTSGNPPANSDGTDRDSDGGTRNSDDHREPSHEITVALCRWCHAKVHNGWARVDDDVEPDPEAIAERESRRSTELDEAGFSTAAERFDTDEADGL